MKREEFYKALLISTCVTLLALFYVLGQTGPLTPSEAVFVAEARTLVERHTMDIGHIEGLNQELLLDGSIADKYNQDPPGTAFLMAPWIVIGKLMNRITGPGEDPDAALILMARSGSCLAMALAVVLIYFISLGLKISPKAALAGVMFLAIASQTWPMAQLATKVPWACLAVALMVYTFYRIMTGEAGAHDYFGLGVACGFMPMLDYRLLLICPVPPAIVLINRSETLPIPSLFWLMMLSFLLMLSILPGLNIIHFGHPVPPQIGLFTAGLWAKFKLMFFHYGYLSPDLKQALGIAADTDPIRFKGLFLAVPLVVVAIVAVPIYWKSASESKWILIMSLITFVLGSIGVVFAQAPWRATAWDLGLLWPIVFPCFALVCALIHYTAIAPRHHMVRYIGLAFISFSVVIGLFEAAKYMLLGHVGLAPPELSAGVVRFNVPDSLTGIGLKGVLILLFPNVSGAFWALIPIFASVLTMLLIAQWIDRVFSEPFDIDEFY